MQRVTEGQELLKFTDDSVEAVRALLKNAVASALADYAEAESIYELSLLEAQTDYDTQKISASYASSIRNTSSSSVANNVTSLQVQLEQKQANAASLQEKLAAAQAKQKINQLDMEETYQETVITGQNAQTTYNATVEDLKETLQEAEETKEKREEQLQAFEDFVGSDGILYAAEDGVITGVGYEAGDRLTTTGTIFSYATADDMRISVDVPQEDIVDLQVGDAVDITFTGSASKTCWRSCMGE